MNRDLIRLEILKICRSSNRGIAEVIAEVKMLEKELFSESQTEKTSSQAEVVLKPMKQGKKQTTGNTDILS